MRFYKMDFWFVWTTDLDSHLVLPRDESLLSAGQQRGRRYGQSSDRHTPHSVFAVTFSSTPGCHKEATVPDILLVNSAFQDYTTALETTGHISYWLGKRFS